MKPVAFAFRLHEVPFVASTMRALGVAVPNELRDVAHYVYRCADEGCAHAFVATAEPEVDETVTADLLAIDEALSAVLEEQWPNGDSDELSFGFHAGLSFGHAVTALTRGGFEVRSFPGDVSERAADGWHAAEQLASKEPDDPSLIEELVLAIPEPLWRSGACAGRSTRQSVAWRRLPLCGSLRRPSNVCSRWARLPSRASRVSPRRVRTTSHRVVQLHATPREISHR